MTKKPKTTVTIFSAGALKPLFKMTSVIRAEKIEWTDQDLFTQSEMISQLTTPGEQDEIDWSDHSSVE